MLTGTPRKKSTQKQNKKQTHTHIKPTKPTTKSPTTTTKQPLKSPSPHTQKHQK